MEASSRTKRKPYSLTARDLNKFLGLNQAQLRQLTEKKADFSPANPGEPIPHEVVRTVLETLGVKYGPRVISFINLKGGVGKTTTAITLAARAVMYGFRVALLDLDPQASASVAFQREAQEGDLIFLDVWKKPEEMLTPALAVIAPDFQLLPSSLENSLLDPALASPKLQKEAVRGVCSALHAMGTDLILIDCPPSLGTAVVSSICASDTIVIPVQNDPFSMKGLELTLNEIESIRDAFGLDIPRTRVLFNRFDRRERITDTAWAEVQKRYPDFVHPVPIPTSTLYSKALEQSQTLFALSDNHPAKAASDSIFLWLCDIQSKALQKGAGRAAKRK